MVASYVGASRRAARSPKVDSDHTPEMRERGFRVYCPWRHGFAAWCGCAGRCGGPCVGPAVDAAAEGRVARGASPRSSFPASDKGRSGRADAIADAAAPAADDIALVAPDISWRRPLVLIR